MNEVKYDNEQEIILDLYKWIKLIFYRKNWSIACYLIIIIFTVFFTLNMQKKYISEAILLVDKSSSTNLSDINPYILNSINMGSAGGFASLLGSSKISDEIEIIQSPLVIDEVIKEMDMKFKAGERKGDYLTTDAFLEKKLLDIENPRDTKIIKISYKSGSPDFAFKLVNSVIDNYMNVSEQINSEKATKDRQFLERELEKVQNKLIQISEELKSFKKKTGFLDFKLDLENLSMRNPYNKKVAAKIAKIPEFEQKGKKIELEFEAAQKKYSFLKEKFEWAYLVEKMSKNATNITILKKPLLKKISEKSEPSLKKNIIIAVIISIIVSSILVVYLELADPKLTFLEINSNKTFWLNNKSQTSIDNLMLTTQNIISNKNFNKIIILSFNIASDEIHSCQEKLPWFYNILKNFEVVEINDFEAFFTINDLIKSNNAIVLLGKVGISNKNWFLKAEELANENENLLYKIILN